VEEAREALIGKNMKTKEEVADVLACVRVRARFERVLQQNLRSIPFYTVTPSEQIKSYSRTPKKKRIYL
jgi:hypothetical protein